MGRSGEGGRIGFCSAMDALSRHATTSSIIGRVEDGPDAGNRVNEAVPQETNLGPTTRRIRPLAGHRVRMRRFPLPTLEYP